MFQTGNATTTPSPLPTTQVQPTQSGRAQGPSDLKAVMAAWERTAVEISQEAASAAETASRIAQGADTDALLGKCDDAQTKSRRSLQRSFDNAHELAGDGDTAMGSETNHMKRKVTPEDVGEKSSRTRSFLNTVQERIINRGKSPLRTNPVG